MRLLRGLSAFPITPADARGHVDTVGLRRLVRRLKEAHVDSIGVLGSTGAYMYLTREERRRALEAASEEVAGGTPIIVGIGALRTDAAIELAHDAKALGATAGLLAPVSYTALTDDEVFHHFSEVARASALPIIVYDNPGTTHFRFSPELVARLAKLPGIVAIKHPAGAPQATLMHLKQERAMVPAAFSIGTAGDATCTEALLCGADTWYSVLGGLLPDVCVRIVRAAQRGDAEEARSLNAALAPVWDLFRRFSSFRVMYTLAGLLEVCHAEPPRPILPVSEPTKREIASVLEHLPATVTGAPGRPAPE